MKNWKEPLLNLGFSLSILLLFTGCREEPTQQLNSEEDSIAPLRIGSFNTLRLGHKEKDFDRIARLLDKSMDVIAIQEVMTEEGAQNLLKAMKKRDEHWNLLLSRTANGEYSYKEFFGFLFREPVIQLAETELDFCIETRTSCYAADPLQGQKTAWYERNPFVGQFSHAGRRINLVSVHLYYGDTSAEKIDERRREAMFLKDMVFDMHDSQQSVAIYIAGDFNLSLEPDRSSSMPEEFFDSENGSELIPYVRQATTIGKRNYDHIVALKPIGTVPHEEGQVEIDFDQENNEDRLKYYKTVSDHYPIAVTF